MSYLSTEEAAKRIEDYIGVVLVDAKAIDPLDLRAIADTLKAMAEKADDWYCEDCDVKDGEIEDLEEEKHELRGDLQNLTAAVNAFANGRKPTPAILALLEAVERYGA